MNSDNLEGKAGNGVGRVEAAAGEIAGDPKMIARGEARQFLGDAQDAVDAVKEKVGRAASEARASISKITDEAADAYDTLRATAQSIGDGVDPFVRQRPYAALALAALAGLMLGVMLFGRGSKVIYVKPARS